jgi:hypothetical protein
VKEIGIQIVPKSFFFCILCIMAFCCCDWRQLIGERKAKTKKNFCMQNTAGSVKNQQATFDIKNKGGTATTLLTLVPLLL